MTTELDQLHTANRRARLVRYVPYGAATILFLIGEYLRGISLGTSVSIAGVVGLAAGTFMLVMARGISQRHAAVVAARPGEHVVEVWGAAGLKAALQAEGITNPPVRASQGTALSMVVTDQGIELWGGTSAPRLIVGYPWSALQAVVEGSGAVANDGAKPAVVLVTIAGNELVLLPARDPAGSLRTAPLAVVRATVADLEARRTA